MGNNFIQNVFDGQWERMFRNLEDQIASCSNYDIYPYFEKYIKKNMKILESGCGLGRWVFYYHRRGYNIIGLDWSKKTVEMIKNYDPSIKVIQGDARKTNFENETFDVIISLGTVEHSIEGPQEALEENYRILKKGGYLLITVPMLTSFRKNIYFLRRKLQLAKAYFLSLFRNKTEHKELKKLINKGIPELYMVTGKSKDAYHFFEYRFPKEKFIKYVKDSGFDIIEVKPSFQKDGLFADFGSIVGKWDYKHGQLNINKFGVLLLKLFPNAFYHHIFVVARKN